MTQVDRVLLLDMLITASDAHNSVQGVSYEEFLRNREKHQSVVFNIQQIGVRANRVSRECVAQIPELPRRMALGSYNCIMNGYSNDRQSEFWNVTMQNLPELIKTLECTLHKCPTQQRG